ncbi:MAG TPA: hypothetical protein VH684_21555, partial [Xanthobacteraceae bacterium]
ESHRNIRNRSAPWQESHRNMCAQASPEGEGRSPLNASRNTQHLMQSDRNALLIMRAVSGHFEFSIVIAGLDLA